MVRSSVWMVLLAGAWLCAACGSSSTSETSAGAAPAAEPKSPGDLFPDGPQKAAVINNCASCHNLACSVIGQRTAERWDSLKASHKDHAPGADVEAMFAYLKANFDSTKPEPKVPPSFLEGGCTPF